MAIAGHDANTAHAERFATYSYWLWTGGRTCGSLAVSEALWPLWPKSACHLFS